MSRRKDLRLSQHDVIEVNRFREYLADMQTMKRDDFYRKYQQYMGLSDDELKTILARDTQEEDK